MVPRPVPAPSLFSGPDGVIYQLVSTPAGYQYVPAVTAVPTQPINVAQPTFYYNTNNVRPVVSAAPPTPVQVPVPVAAFQRSPQQAQIPLQNQAVQTQPIFSAPQPQPQVQPVAQQNVEKKSQVVDLLSFDQGCCSSSNSCGSVSSDFNLAEKQEAPAQYTNQLVFYVNGKKVVLYDVNPRTTLNEYLRSAYGLQGTKRSCEEVSPPAKTHYSA
jgi:hypothetical protein